MIPPTATYRLQLNKDFTFADAMALVPYLDELGVSHVYLSPILMARPGSTHGYDTVDHTRVNPELGTIADFRLLATALRQRQMGIILDFVPNHMGVGGAHNKLWLDVLRHGRASRYADWFDIDWSRTRPGMEGKLLVPFLGSSFAEALAEGRLQLKRDGDGFAVWAYDAEKLPIRDDDARALLARHHTADAAIAAYAGQVGHPGSWHALDSLISNQHWRLAHFSVAADEINYRRFFINSDLAGIRIDHPDVFEHAHALIFQLIAEGLVDGLRIDHIDGLLDPGQYLQTLRAKAPREIYLIVEKILAPHERLRADWPVEGTTGYEVGTALTRVLMRAGAEGTVTNAYAQFVGDVTPAHAEAYRCKLRVMDNELSAELQALAGKFATVAWAVETTRDLPQAAICRALRETIAQLSVYRTYADDAGTALRDRREISRAVGRARREQPQLQPAIFDFVAGLLCGRLGVEYDPRSSAAAIGSFQQYAGPVMAKGLEDTALYRYNRLLALNEVGGHPQRFALTIAAFHDANLQRLKTHPYSMIATSTHDTKRGEDTRAIIAAIADLPDVWTTAVGRWRSLLQVGRNDPIHANDLYLFFQLLLGGWPISGPATDLGDRLKATLTKSIREARQRSDWAVPTAYETTVTRFVDAALANQGFLDSFQPVRSRLAEVGLRKAIIQATLKLTIPGVPDIYRGAEDWEQSFVDPDNRRPIDFADLATRLRGPVQGRDSKLILTRSLLQLRRRLPLLFAEGSYEPIDSRPGILGFQRRTGSHRLVVLADLSPCHSAGVGPTKWSMPTVFGSPEQPVWVMAA